MDVCFPVDFRVSSMCLGVWGFHLSPSDTQPGSLVENRISAGLLRGKKRFRATFQNHCTYTFSFFLFGFHSQSAG